MRDGSLAGPINSTVTASLLTVFVCPSDGISPDRGTPAPYNNTPASATANTNGGLTNNYLASVGPDALYPQWANSNLQANPPTSYDVPGMFGQGSSRCAGVQSVTDGTSNTIAYGEALVGDRTIELVKFRDGPASTLPFAGGGPFKNVTGQYQAVIADLNSCQSAFINTPAPAQFQGSVNLKGAYWAWDNGGMSLFNTIVPPSSSQYSFGWCQLATSSWAAGDGNYENANSNHPGGANFLFADGGVPLHQIVDQHPDILGARDQGRRRGYLVR